VSRTVFTLRQALSDSQLLAHVMTSETYRAQKVLSLAAMGEALTDDERAIFQKFTKRIHEPLQRVAEFAMVSGRRTGETLTCAMLASYLATCIDYGDVLVRGEVGVVLVLAQSQRVAASILDYIEANITSSPVLRQHFVGRSADTIELTGNVRIEVRPVSFRKLRGPTYVAIICDELSFWFTEDYHVDTDVEVLAAARMGLLTTRGILIMASSPYAKRGVLWDTYHRHFGPDGSPTVLVTCGATAALNPTIPQAELDAEMLRDPVRNKAELLAIFRDDIANFMPLDTVEANVGDYVELPPSTEFTYKLGVDAASGTGEDSFSAAVSHRDNDIVIVDGVWEWRPPFAPSEVIAEIAKTIAARYHVSQATGDRYAGGFAVEIFKKNNLAFEATKQPKSDYYRDLAPILNSKRCVLPRNPRLVAQIAGLERQVGRSGKDTISHPPNGHDDVANAVAIAVSLAFAGVSMFGSDSRWLDGDDKAAAEDTSPQQTYESYRKARDSIKRPEWLLELLGKKKKTEDA
jgi:hypothetical protein